MLENIKMLLGIEDSTQDKFISYHIETVIQAVCNLIKEDTLPAELTGVVERKVIQLIQNGLDANRITQIDRGDYKVKFSFESKSPKSLLSDCMGDLKPFMKKVRYY